MKKDWKESQQLAMKNPENFNRENVLIGHENKYHSGRLINNDDEIYYGFLHLVDNRYELIIFHLDEYGTLYKHCSSDVDEISNIPQIEYK